jgi:uncharacterized protein (DUF111 family)
VLCRPDVAADIQQLITDHTTTLGVRSTRTSRTPLSRGWSSVEVAGHPVAIKIGYDQAGVRQVNPEFDDVAGVAAAVGLSEREVLDRARAAARAAGLVIGAPPPAALDNMTI